MLLELPLHLIIPHYWKSPNLFSLDEWIFPMPFSQLDHNIATEMLKPTHRFPSKWHLLIEK